MTIHRLTQSSPSLPPASFPPQSSHHAIDSFGVTVHGVRYEIARTEDALRQLLDQLRQRRSA